MVWTIFLDLKKAFDTVNHLISKLANFKFSSNMGGSETSTFLSNEMGVPQGSILGPLLFSVYVNDLPLVCTRCEVQMYADSTIYVHARTKEQAASRLRAIMTNVTKWLDDSHLFLNVKKTVLHVFLQRHTLHLTVIPNSVSGQIIQVVSHVKYL